MDICFARPFGTAGNPGDLGDPEPDHMAEHDCFTLRSGEGVESSLPCLGIRWIEVKSGRVGGLLDQSRATCSVPEMVAPDVQSDGPHPWLQAKLSYPLGRIPGEGVIGPDKCFLTQVLSLMPVTRHPAEAPIETRRHVLHQTRESIVEIAGEVSD